MYLYIPVHPFQFTYSPNPLYLMGSFHMMSQARGLSSIGSGRGTGISLMEEIRPSPRVGRGIPPWTQNTWRERERERESVCAREAQMFTYLIVNDSCNGHCIKGFVGCLPHLQSQFLTKLLYAFTACGTHTHTNYESVLFTLKLVECYALLVSGRVRTQN